MLTRELKKKSPRDLQKFVLERKRELMNLRFQQSSAQLQNTARIREVRKEIARAKTLLHAVAAPQEKA